MLGAICAPASVRTRQIGSTPNSSLWASMKATISGRGGRAPPRRSRRALQNRVRPAQLSHLTLELGQPGRVIGRHARPVALVNLGLDHPVAQRLGVDAQLLADPLQRPGPGGWVTPRVDHHPGRSLPQLVGVLPRCRHDSHPHVDCEPPSDPVRDKRNGQFPVPRCCLHAVRAAQQPEN